MKQISGHCWHDLHVKTVPEDQGQLWCKYEMNLDAILCLSDGAIKMDIPNWMDELSGEDKKDSISKSQQKSAVSVKSPWDGP